MSAEAREPRDRSIYVIEVAPRMFPDADPSVATEGYLYVGWTKNSDEYRLAQHMNAHAKAAVIFKDMVEALGRPLKEDEAWLRPDLVTEKPTGDSEGQANRAERRQANQLENQRFRIISRHKHGMKRRSKD